MKDVGVIEGLDVALLPGEYVIYKTSRIRVDGKRLKNPSVAVTNKRVLIGSRAAYGTVFYEKICSVKMEHILRGSAVHMALAGHETEKGYTIITTKAKALSLFSILSNMVAYTNDLRNYGASVPQNAHQDQQKPGESTAANSTARIMDLNTVYGMHKDMVAFADTIKAVEQKAEVNGVGFEKAFGYLNGGQLKNVYDNTLKGMRNIIRTERYQDSRTLIAVESKDIPKAPDAEKAASAQDARAESQQPAINYTQTEVRQNAVFGFGIIPEMTRPKLGNWGISTDKYEIGGTPALAPQVPISKGVDYIASNVVEGAASLKYGASKLFGAMKGMLFEVRGKREFEFLEPKELLKSHGNTGSRISAGNVDDALLVFKVRKISQKFRHGK
ncbi:MAG: hypothetical protein LVQ97_05005 [Candidatus Micrarchaeales archaeon]|jgi:hypothetical protein|uniref:Uncharacterized protein n=1 Tax=Candidatus Micrarchaeum acidiphilum ARMAN-2 TaxID=425595 RepID=C7DGT3_MICA2|nr:MAG: hypothetical protein UNLARM2_0283 [Candidatus Micrarchaeum acidiphilum ARMAN-2]MCW6161518.1 hypothetical protein [Candidatus Micrarchaeales archaeon]